MTIICSWCKREIGQKNNQAGQPGANLAAGDGSELLTHGMCPACRDRIEPELQRLEAIARKGGPKR